MTIYLVILFFILFNVLFELSHIVITPKIFIYAFGALLLIITAGLRYGLESDYWHYYYVFNQTIKVDTLESGFSFLIFFTRLFTNSYTVFCIILAVLGLGIVTRTIYKYKYPYVMLACYYTRFYILFNLNAVRQGIAVAFIFLGLHYLNDKKRYIFWILVATLFHASSILMLPCIFFRKKQFSIRTVIICLTVALIFRFTIFNSIINSFVSYIPFVLNSNDNIIRGTQYIINSGDKMETMNYLSFVRIIIQAFALYYLQKDCEDHKMYKIYLVGFVLNIIFWGLDTVSFRVPADFYLSECFVLNQAFEFRLKPKGVFLCLSILVLGLDISSLLQLFGTSTTLIPYRTVFSK